MLNGYRLEQLSPAEIALIGRGLGFLPYSEVVNLINKVQQQITVQETTAAIQAEIAKTEEAAKAAEAATPAPAPVAPPPAQQPIVDPGHSHNVSSGPGSQETPATDTTEAREAA